MLGFRKILLVLFFFLLSIKFVNAKDKVAYIDIDYIFSKT